MIRRTEGIRRNYELPVLNKEDKLAVNSEKAEPLAETFKKVHCPHNLTEEIGQSINRTLVENHKISETRGISEDSFQMPLSIFELRRAINSALQPLAHMTDSRQDKVSKLSNRVLETGKLLRARKQAAVVSVLKPGNYP